MTIQERLTAIVENTKVLINKYQGAISENHALKERITELEKENQLLKENNIDINELTKYAAHNSDMFLNEKKKELTKKKISKFVTNLDKLTEYLKYIELKK